MSSDELPEECKTLADAAKAVGAIEDPERPGFFICENGSQGRRLIKLLDGDLTYPESREHQTYTFYARNDDVKCRTPAIEGEKMGRQWMLKKKEWCISLHVKPDQRSPEDRASVYDESVRSVSILGDDGFKSDLGFFLTDSRNRWHRRPTEKAKLQLYAKYGIDETVRIILGHAAGAPWTRVNLPFQPEYPGNREWNMGAAQLICEPAPGSHPHWDMILNHIGQELTTALATDPWAKRSGIQSGAAYLTAWAAAMIRNPFEPLPYLFLYGPEQNAGKSIYHEALAQLMTKGVASADRALTNANDFNGELANAVLAYIEEKDIKLSGGAYNRIKDWVTSPVLWVHKKNFQPYPQPNCLHFVHCANTLACPMSFGDSRITMIRVWPFKQPEIPKRSLLAALRAEAPQFIHTLLNFPLPNLEGRLGLPVVATASKQAEIDSTQPELVRAVVEHMAARGEATLTTAKFADEFGPGNWPTDLRLVKRVLNTATPYLRSKGIAVEYPAHKVSDHWPIHITRRDVA